MVICFLTKEMHEYITTGGCELRTGLEGRVGDSLCKIRPNLVMLNLRVIDVNEGLLGLEILNESDSR